MKITIETLDGQIITGEVITLAELNKMARNNCHGLTYLMNVMDTNADKGADDAYMWFKDDRTDKSYLMVIK